MIAYVAALSPLTVTLKGATTTTPVALVSTTVKALITASTLAVGDEVRVSIRDRKVVVEMKVVAP